MVFHAWFGKADDAVVVLVFPSRLQQLQPCAGIVGFDVEHLVQGGVDGVSGIFLSDI